MTNPCQWLYLVETGQEGVWGHEAVALAEVARSGVPVLPAFVVSKEAVTAFFTQSSLKKAIVKTFKSAPASKPELLAGAAKEIRAHIREASLPPELHEEFVAFLRELEDQVLVKPGSGLRITFTELNGHTHHHSLTEVLRSTAQGEKLFKQLLALSFTEHLLHDRMRKDTSIVPGPYTVLVQYGEEASASGTAFSYDFSQHDDSTITIHAHFHEQAKKERLAVQDEYRVDRNSLLMLSRSVASHAWAEKRSGKHAAAAQQGQAQPVLNDTQVLMLARMVKRAQALFNEPFSFHWVFAHNQLFITRLEPLQDEIDRSQRAGSTAATGRDMPLPLLLGLPGNLGWASGPVRVIAKRDDHLKIEDGDVVVLEHVLHGDHQWLAGAAALVCEGGHHASQEAQLAKQLGIPAVIATGTALTHLNNGQVVTVDGSHGAVYAGKLPVEQQQAPAHASVLPVTGTKVLATVLDPQTVTREELLAADGIGLLRSEFILRMLGVHPQDIIRKKLEKEYIDILAEGIEQAVRAVYPRPVIYQLHDVHTAHTLGWRERHHDRHEPNPTLGYRGTHRLLAEPEVLELELQALNAVLAQGITNLSLMLPMVRSLEEVEEMRTRLAGSPVALHGELPLWVKCETPALAIRAEELCELPIKGVCFDIPALASLIVGMDKENYQVAHHLDQADEAVEQAVSYAIATCRANGVSTMVVAEMEELRPEMIQAAIQAGVTAVSVAPADIEEVHGLIASIEQRMLLDHLLAEGEPSAAVPVPGGQSA